MYKNTNCLMQAHRGVSSDAPENTLSAYRLAKEQGYDIIEFDARFTKDNVCVIYHDGNVNRTVRVAGEPFPPEPKRPISDFTFAELAEFDVGEWFDKKYCGEHIVSLAQALDYMKSIDIEGKLDNILQNYTDEQLDIFFNTIKKHGTEKIGITVSTRLDILERFAKEFPNHNLHYDGDVTPEILEKLAEISKGHLLTVWMHPDLPNLSWCKVPAVTPEMAALVKQYGFRLGLWILKTEEEMEVALSLGADVVETNGQLKPY